MSTEFTAESLWKLFSETDRRFKETERLIKERALETDRQIKEASLKTDRQIKEASLKTDRQIKEASLKTDRQIKEAAQETDRQIKEAAQETDRLMKETDRKLKQVSKNLGEIGNRLGEFVEHMVAPAVVRLFREQGIDVHTVYSGMSSKRDGVALEIDLLVVNDGALVAVECKSKLTTDHIDQHLTRLSKLKQALPIYKHHKVMGAVAGMVVPDDVVKYALEQGLYLLCQNGEQIHLHQPSHFEPAVW